MTEEQQGRIKQLVEALRSGKYQQGKRALRKNNKYCCLGVACDLYLQANPVAATWSPHVTGPEHAFTVGDFRSSSVLPKPVSDWYGIDENPYLDGLRTAASLNDAGRSFSEIADLFESKFLGGVA